MIHMIIGASSSGKSEYAENLAMSLGSDRVYIATMKPHGKEAERKIKRHRDLREGKNFVTVEACRDIGIIDIHREKGIALLECISNLTANEMFDDTGLINEDPSEKIIADISTLSRRFEHMVIVTNDVFSDGEIYDELTVKYMKNLARINIELAKLSDSVTEIVCTVPNVIKP